MASSTPDAAVRGFFETFNRGDIDALMAFFDPNARLVPQPGQVVEGRTAIREALSGFLALKGALAAEKELTIASGDTALSVVKWSLKGGTGPDGKPVELGGTTSDVLRRQVDGSWRYVIDNPWGCAALG